MLFVGGGGGWGGGGGVGGGLRGCGWGVGWGVGGCGGGGSPLRGGGGVSLNRDGNEHFEIKGKYLQTCFQRKGRIEVTANVRSTINRILNRKRWKGARKEAPTGLGTLVRDLAFGSVPKAIR